MRKTSYWDAMVDGQLDISAFPLDYASGKHPQFSATLMPGLVKNHEHAKRLNDSAFMEDIKKIVDESGIMVLSDAWLAGGGVRGGYVHGATDEFGFKAVENRVHVHDLHATLLHLLGFDHERFTYRYAGRDFRLTDVHGRVVRELIA